MMGLCALPHPLPASPIKGEVLSCGLNAISPHEWRDTSPLMGEARRGWSHARRSQGAHP